MFKQKLMVAAIATAGMIAASSASAQVYVGASIGESTANLDCSGTTNCKTSDTAYKFTGGYSFSPVWAVEASYFDLGKIKGTVDGYNVAIKTSGFDIAAVAKSQLSADWSMFGKLGVASVKAEDDVTSGFGSGSLSKTSTQPVLGFGVLYKMNQNLNLRADIDTRKVKTIDSSQGDYNVTNFSLGVQASF